MRQAGLRRAGRPPGEWGRRPRVLIEDDRPAPGAPDFSAFLDAGFDVTYCSGPYGGPNVCPLLRGEECDVVAGADVVLHGSEPRCGVAAAISWWHREIPVVRAGPDCSAGARVEAVRRALSGTPATRDAGRR